MKKKITKQFVRENLPECTMVADLMRQVFGEGVKMVYAKENGIEIGQPSMQDRPSVTLDKMELGSYADNSTTGKRKSGLHK